MKNIWILLTIFFFEFTYADDVVKTELTTNNTYELSIIQVFPDSFPNISVIFDAENEEGLPLWNLKKEGINVFEDNQDCQVISVKNISKERGVNMGLVIDASSSMIFDEQINTTDQALVWNHYTKWNNWPKWYKKPIDFAKESILSFLENDYSQKDSFLVVPFWDTVDKKHQLSSDLSHIKKIINEINPDGGTGFYDAVYYSINKLSKSSNQPVVVALTDGMDNASDRGLKEVVEFAIEKNIKIFVVGLGKADKKMLTFLATETGGQFFYTKEAKDLSEIYLKIKSRIKSIYELKYISENNDYKDETRKVKFEFVNNAFKFNNDTFDYTLPVEVLNYLQEKEEIRKRQALTRETELAKLEIEKAENERYLLMGGLLIVLLGGIGFYISNSLKKKSKILNFYPNPVEENITIEYKISDIALNSTLSLKNTRGRTVRKVMLNKETTQIDLNLNSLKKGWYFATIITDVGKSESVKIFKK